MYEIFGPAIEIRMLTVKNDLPNGRFIPFTPALCFLREYTFFYQSFGVVKHHVVCPFHSVSLGDTDTR